MAFLSQAFGFILIASGVVAILRRKAKGSAEGDDEREYRGPAAIGLGSVWIVVGVCFVLFPSLMR